MTSYYGEYGGNYDGNYWGQGSGVPANTVLGLTTAFVGAPGGSGLRWRLPEEHYATESDSVWEAAKRKVLSKPAQVDPEERLQKAKKLKDDLKSKGLSQRIAKLEERVKFYKDKADTVIIQPQTVTEAPRIDQAALERAITQAITEKTNIVIQSHLADAPIQAPSKALQAVPFALTALGMGLITYYRFPRRPKVYRTLGYTSAIALAIKALTCII